MGGLGLFGLWLVLILVVAASILIAVASIWVGDRTLSDSVGKTHNSTLSPFVTTVALVYGALLGFTVVVAWEQFSTASANVASEASTLTTMYRQTVAMPPAEQQQMRDLLRKYTTAVAGPEWERQDSGGTSDSARSAITEMYRVLSRQDPNASSGTVNGEFMSQLTVLASQRNARVLDAEPRIPWLLWCGLVFGGLVLIGLMGFMRLESNRGHAVLSSAVAILLGLLLFIIFCLDHPFGTKTGVTSAPYKHSLEVFDAVDGGK